MARARAIALWSLTVEVVLLTVTGVALYFLYRPEPAAAWTDADGLGSSLGREVRLAHLLADVHAWAAWLALPTAVVSGVLLALRARVAERVARGMALGVGLVVVVGAAQVSGLLLPWDQLALSAVTVGTSLSGYTWLWDDTVRFVLVDRTELAPATMLKWLLVHVAAGVGVAGLVALGWRRARHPGSTPSTAPLARADVSAIA